MTPLTPEQSQMVENNIKLAYHEAWKLVHKFPLDFEEILSICFITLCESVQKFDPSKGFKFSTYATKVMYYRVLATVNPQVPQIKCLYLEELLPLEDGQTWEDLLGTYDIEDEIVCEIAAKQIIAQLDKIKINEKYREIMKLHFYRPELMQDEIAGIVGCGIKTVHWALKTARDKLRPMVCMG